MLHTDYALNCDESVIDCVSVPWVCLQFVIVVFPDHTHLLFLKSRY